ncbi:hypothetical protein [uncultured Shewanella sp.]|uniref:hypothetical protein n=1 Tax=Shewanella atlantica TaxID=271099 RepID=UPI002637F615|nr:hypothetical protein [uncultured Shewanella sp.]
MVLSQVMAGNESRDIHRSDDAVDWCHIQESLKILLLAMAQIELSLTDGEHNVTELGSLFTKMAKHLDGVNSYLSQQADTPAEITSHGEDLAASINEGVVAFQFYDRVSQRLQHVIMGLALMEEVLNSKQLRISPDAWKKLQQEIQQSYSLDCERKMFDLVLQGTPIHEALKLYRDENQSAKEDDIELF